MLHAEALPVLNTFVHYRGPHDDSTRRSTSAPAAIVSSPVASPRAVQADDELAVALRALLGRLDDLLALSSRAMAGHEVVCSDAQRRAMDQVLDSMRSGAMNEHGGREILLTVLMSAFAMHEQPV